MDTNKMIFITNVFAEHHTEEHIKLWNQFLRETPENQRSGFYGADSSAYVKWLKQKENATFLEFMKNNISIKTL